MSKLAVREQKEAIADGWFAWLQDHPVSMGDICTEAIRGAVKAWLDEHATEIKTMVADRAAKNLAETP